MNYSNILINVEFENVIYKVNVTVQDSEQGVLIGKYLENIWPKNYLYNIVWGEDCYFEPITLTDDYLSGNGVEDICIGLKVKNMFFSGHISKSKGSPLVIIVHNGHLFYIRYVHELQIVCKILKGYDLL